jgi:hypothetical protein
VDAPGKDEWVPPFREGGEIFHSARACSCVSRFSTIAVYGWTGESNSLLVGETTTGAAVICLADSRLRLRTPLVDPCVCTAVLVKRQARATKGSTRHIGDCSAAPSQQQQRVVPGRDWYVLERYDGALCSAGGWRRVLGGAVRPV